ncbi:MAG TPA: hypothetical protein VFE47_22600 [Tepidisphaeraceae bacterium]|jgi:hypothetical protein|nr:hypothetical protein [Tepidisphaeraceae bacterium]
MNTTLNRDTKAVRYRFRGLIRDTGKAVEGHVEADSEEFAFHLLANNGIVTESLRTDPRPEDIQQSAASAPKANLLPPLAQAMMSTRSKRPALPAPAQGANPATGQPTQPYIPPPVDHSPIPGTKEVVNAIDTALDTSSSQIEFDALTERYRGKKVWVIDRDKIKRNVARVVDQAITDSLKNADNAADTRKSVADAIEKLFTDNRNLTSPQGTAGSGAGGANLDRQIERLSSVIKNFENSLASMQMAIRNMGAGGGGGGFVPRRNMGQAQQAGLREEQNAVLLEIFKTNMDLLRNMEDEMRSANTTVESVTAATGS